MVLHDDSLLMRFKRYGIQIPVLDERSTTTMAELRRLLGSRGKWEAPFEPPLVTRADLERVHDADYVARLYNTDLESELLGCYELIRNGKPWRYCPELAEAPLTELFTTLLLHAGGSIQAGQLALDQGFCFFLGGGMHHAMPGYGEGFCLVNDIVVALSRLRSEGRAKRFWVIDIDAHKGDGTAVLCQNDPDCATLSIHMAHAWPLDEAPHDEAGRLKPSFVPSSVDIPIAYGEDSRYLPRLKQGLVELAEILPDPDLVWVVAGADPYEYDELPSTAGLRLSLPQMLSRDQLVLDFLETRRLPSAWLMAGGYGGRSWEVYTQFLHWYHTRK